jgi:flagellar motor protein MotB
MLNKQLHLIKEIQIQGHANADIISLRNGNDNLNLASKRAITVVRFLRDHKDLKIDPAKFIYMRVPLDSICL